MTKWLMILLLGAVMLSCSPAPVTCPADEGGVVGTGITLDVIDLESQGRKSC